MGTVAPTHWVVVIIASLVILVVFNGSKKIPELARSMGRGARIFKSEVNELKNDDAKREMAKNAEISTPIKETPGIA